MKVNYQIKRSFLYNNSGVSLIEIVLSVAILGIIVTAFFPLFNFGYSNVSEIGEKNKAMSLLQSKMDLVYTISDIESNTSDKINEVSAILGATYDNVNTTTYTVGVSYKFTKQNISMNVAGVSGTVNGTKVTIVYFYKGDSRYVSLSTLKRWGA